MFIVKKLSDNSKDYLDTYYNIVDQIQKDVGEITLGSSISEAYIKQIVPVFKGGIDMSENILKYTTNVDVESFAKNVIFDFQSNIDKLNALPDTCTCECNSERDVKLYTRKFDEIFNHMLTLFNANVSGNNLDLLYLGTLTTLLEGIINMTKNALSFTLCADLKQIATDIIDEQTLHLKTIKSLLKGMV